MDSSDQFSVVRRPYLFEQATTSTMSIQDELRPPPDFNCSDSADSDCSTGSYERHRRRNIERNRRMMESLDLKFGVTSKVNNKKSGRRPDQQVYDKREKSLVNGQERKTKGIRRSAKEGNLHASQGIEARVKSTRNVKSTKVRTVRELFDLNNRSIEKFFASSQKLHLGSVTHVKPPLVPNDDWLFRVEYDDGGCEDLDHREIDAFLVRRSRGRPSCSKNTTKRTTNEKQELVGCVIWKFFSRAEQYFSGTIRAYLPADNDLNVDLFEVFYDDGDTEQLEEHELNDHLIDRSLVLQTARKDNRSVDSFTSGAQSEETRPRKRKQDLIAAAGTDISQEDQLSQDSLNYDGPGDARHAHDGATRHDDLESPSEYVAGEYTNEEFYFPGTQPIRTIKHECDVCDKQARLELEDQRHKILTGDGLMWTHDCSYCGCTLFQNDRAGDSCCMKNRVVEVLDEHVPDFFDRIPNELDFLYFGRKTFQRQARLMNYAFNFSSIGVSGEHGFADKYYKGGPKMVTIHGTTYTRMISVNDPKRSHMNPMYSRSFRLSFLTPKPTLRLFLLFNPVLRRWFLIDPDARSAYFAKGGAACTKKSLGPTGYRLFEEFMRLRSPIGQAFKQVPVSQYTSMDATIVLRHKRQANEVAAVIVDDVRNVTVRDVIIQRKQDSSPTKISSLNALYEVLRYPVLFPTQHRGWGMDLNRCKEILVVSTGLSR